MIVDGAPGLEAALTALWGAELPIQRCTVHKHRNLLSHAPKHLHDELTEDYRDMIYAETAAEVETRRKAFVRKWRLKCKATGKVTIIHEELVDLNMPAMTIVFRVAEPAMLESMSERQEISFVADRLEGKLTVVKLQ